MKKQIKTLDESAKELKTSVNRLHQARVNFIRAYEQTLIPHHLGWNDMRDLGMSEREISNRIKLEEYTPYQPGVN